MLSAVERESIRVFWILDRCYNWLEEHVRWANRNVLAVPIILAASWVVALPSLRHLLNWQPSWAEEAQGWKVQHPLSSIPVERFAKPVHDLAGISDHLRKCTYRITVPLIAHVLGLNSRGAQVLGVIGSIAFLIVLFRSFGQISGNPLIALLLSLAAACAYLGQWGMHNPYFYDGAGYFLLAAAAYTKRPVFISLLLILGGFCDERVILAAPLLYLLHGDFGTTQFRVVDIVRPNKRQCGILLAGCIFVLLRLGLGYYVGRLFDSTEVGMGILRYNIAQLPLAWMLVYKGATLVIATGFLSLLTPRFWRSALLVSLAVIPGVLGSLMVSDVSRSLNYTFPVLLLCTKALTDSENAVTLRRVSVCAAAISLLTPTYELFEGKIHTFGPIFRLLLR